MSIKLIIADNIVFHRRHILKHGLAKIEIQKEKTVLSHSVDEIYIVHGKYLEPLINDFKSMEEQGFLFL